MPSPNKIKVAEQEVDSHSQSFQLFLSSLRQQRPMPPEPSPSEAPLSEPEPQFQSKEIFSEGAKSLYFNSPAKCSPQKCQGDPVLRNHHRIGHANRYTVKQYQIPSQFFTPAKKQLQQHLQNSRIFSNASTSPPQTNNCSPNNQHHLFR